MRDPIEIRDPRHLASAVDDAKNSALSIFLPHRDKPIRDALLLCNLLWAYPSDMMLYRIDGPPRKIAHMWSRFTPERSINSCIGITSLTDASRLRLTNFFDMECSWFEWYFVAFDRHQLAAVEGVISEASCFADRADPLARYARYSIHCNRDMGETEILVYDERLFDPMIDLMKGLCNERSK